MKVIDNQTRYSSEGLKAVLATTKAALEAESGEGASMYPSVVKVRTFSTATNLLEGVRTTRDSPYTYRWGYEDSVVLNIRAPKHLPETDPLRVLAMAGEERSFLSHRVVRDIAKWYMLQCYLPGVTKDYYRAVNQVELPEVEVLERVVNPRPAIKKTDEERVASYLSKHGNPSYIMEGSSKTPQYKWTYELQEMKNYYDREWERREKWRVKAEKLSGEDIRKHLTFGQFLRWAADQILADPKTESFWTKK